MSVESQLQKASAQAKAKTPFIEAFFKGTYYKGSAAGTEPVPFEVKAKIPVSWVQDPNLNPPFVFKKFFAQRLLDQTPSNIRFVELVRTGELPSHLPLNQELDWTADYEKLVQIAQNIGKRPFISVNLEDGTQKQGSVEVDVNLWASPSELREAIRRCVADAEAFSKEQKSRAESSVIAQRNMEAELADLGY